MIYTVTFNPAIDYVMQVGEIKQGVTNRSTAEEMHFGGKGINVSVVLSQLGADTTALGFIAGFTGEALEKGVKSHRIKTDFVHLDKGNTRINLKLKGETETEINAAGPHIPPNAVAELFNKLNRLKDGDTLVLAGSIPSSLPCDIYEKIAESLKEKKIRLVIDASGELLLNTLKYGPFLIKPNRQELEEIFKKEFNTENDIITAMGELKKMGAQNVLVSLGSEGAILMDSSENIFIQKAFDITAVNTVGSGDSMIAGFLFGYDEMDAEYGLRLGSAAGAATASLPSLATKEVIYKILNEK